MFRKVDSKTDFSRLEQNILHFWKERRIYSQSIAAREGAPHYVFYEGPPTANGSPGVHHALSRLFKDIICRYKTMKSYHVPRKAGWDTHGLPVELEVEHALGFTNKTQIEDYGVARFNSLCRQSALSYIKKWEAMTERIGYWIDMEHPYITLDNDYIESCWWIIKELWNKGLIYQGYKVTPYCPRCGTSLSSHEVSLGYKDDTEDPSVYIKFRVPKEVVSNYLVGELQLHLDPSLPTYLLAWTTTPWTLPGNTALAVAPEADYTFVKIVIENRSEQFILAKALLSSVLVDQYEVLGTCKGKKLMGERIEGKGVVYEPLYRLPEQLYSRWKFVFSGGETVGLWGLIQESPAKGENFWLIVEDFVSLDEGTGIVHVAPAFGEVDYKAGYSAGLYFVQPVDEQGIMIGDPLFAGKFVKDADHIIIEDLKLRKLLYRSEKIIHTYPFCWRCDSPLLYYAKKSWYIKTTTVKDRLVSGNSEISWYPDHIKYGRFGNWLENNVDWAFSRERYWGTPLNIWCCSSCSNYECVASIDDLKRKPNLKGLETPLDLHRPYVDGAFFSCSKCGGEMRRVPEVIDCWFDSGAMPIAQWHYPFENGDKFRGNFPADFICEAIDQTRGWFYSLHAISTLLFDQSCFKNVLCLGHVVDAQGEKMSKSKGNIVNPQTVIDKYGADALRWYMLVSAAPEDNHRFSTDMLLETMRRFLLTLWNTYSFFTLYANIDCFTPKSSLDEEFRSANLLDRWIISRLNWLTAETTKALDNYNPTLAARQIERFVGDLSNWYIRRNRRRFWKSESDADKLAAHTTLYQCLVTLSQLLAPLTPFIAEEIYQNLVCSVNPGAKESVHLTDFPKADESKIDDELNNDVELAMKISSLGRAARAKAGIKVRQPLAKLLVKVDSVAGRSGLKRLQSQVLEEVNVKELQLVEDIPEMKLSEWPKVMEGALTVMLDTEISPELHAEGVAREVVRRLQNMRRTAQFDVADHIITYYQAEGQVKQTMANLADYIKQETLSLDLLDAPPPEDAYSERHNIAGSEILLAIKKVA